MAATKSDRNNNPGNLKPGYGDNIWDNQTGTDEQGFAVFRNRAAGIRAADLNLQTYAKRGWNSIFDVIHHWSSTDQADYTNYVATKMGVSPTEKLNLDNPQVRQKLLGHIFDFEGSAYR